MSLILEQTKAFKKSLKKYRHKQAVLKELKYIVQLLVSSKPIPSKYRDHALNGNYQGVREIHLKPDALLLYSYKNDDTIILLVVGSHSDFF